MASTNAHVQADRAATALQHISDTYSRLLSSLALQYADNDTEEQAVRSSHGAAQRRYFPPRVPSEALNFSGLQVLSPVRAL